MRARHTVKLQRRVIKKAKEFQTTAAELHSAAPRGGDDVNAFGLRRSAPGEAPAGEFGTLEDILTGPVVITAQGALAAVNYDLLEKGYAPNNLEPRPLGRLTLALVKRS